MKVIIKSLVCLFQIKLLLRPTPLMTLDHKFFPFWTCSFSRFIKHIKKEIFISIGCTILINEYCLFRVLPRECFVYVVHAASLAIFALFFMNIQVQQVGFR